MSETFAKSGEVSFD